MTKYFWRAFLVFKRDSKLCGIEINICSSERYIKRYTHALTYEFQVIVLINEHLVDIKIFYLWPETFVKVLGSFSKCIIGIIAFFWYGYPRDILFTIENTSLLLLHRHYPRFPATLFMQFLSTLDLLSNDIAMLKKIASGRYFLLFCYCVR